MSRARLEHLYRQVPIVMSEVELSTYMIEVHFGFDFRGMLLPASRDGLTMRDQREGVEI